MSVILDLAEHTTLYRCDHCGSEENLPSGARPEGWFERHGEYTVHEICGACRASNPLPLRTSGSEDVE